MDDHALFRRSTAAAAFAATSIWIWFLLLGDRLRWQTDDEFLHLHLDPLHTVRNLLSLISFVAALAAMAGLRERVAGHAAGPARLAWVAFAIGTAIDGLYRAVEGVTVETLWAAKALTTADPTVQAAYLDKIDTFREVGEGVYPVFGTFFVLAFLLFALAARHADRALALLLLASGLAMATLYLASFLETPPPGAAWTAYELLMISLYVRLGIVLGRRWPTG